MFDSLAKSALEVFTGTQADKDRVQDQLKPVLEQRFKPCLDLWQPLWDFAANPEPAGKDVEDLIKVVGDFVRVSGALVSLAFLDALWQLRLDLLSATEGDDLARSVKLGRVKARNLLPSSEKDGKGNAVDRPGVLLLLRDEIGSNARSMSSMVKG